MDSKTKRTLERFGIFDPDELRHERTAELNLKGYTERVEQIDALLRAYHEQQLETDV